MKLEQQTWNKILRIAIIIAMPFFLGLGMMTLVIHWEWPTYPEWEYGRIPPDQFGFTPEERLDLAVQDGMTGRREECRFIVIPTSRLHMPHRARLAEP